MKYLDKVYAKHTKARNHNVTTRWQDLAKEACKEVEKLRLRILKKDKIVDTFNLLFTRQNHRRLREYKRA